jgi:archaellum biogenesis protein FlaJ (TadC family)
MIEWIKANDALFWWLAAASVVTFVGSLIVVPMLVARIPADYFSHEKRPRSRLDGQSPPVRLVLVFIKNVMGVLLMFGGLAMLVLPGQGLLTLLIGLMLIDLPGKYRFEKWLVSRKRIASGINWLRRRAGREPLEVERV